MPKAADWPTALALHCAACACVCCTCGVLRAALRCAVLRWGYRVCEDELDVAELADFVMFGRQVHLCAVW